MSLLSKPWQFKLGNLWITKGGTFHDVSIWIGTKRIFPKGKHAPRFILENVRSLDNFLKEEK